MLEDIRNADSALDVTVQHLANQIKTVFAHDIWYAQVVVHNFVNTVEGVLLVDNGI